MLSSMYKKGCLIVENASKFYNQYQYLNALLYQLNVLDRIVWRIKSHQSTYYLVNKVNTEQGPILQVQAVSGGLGDPDLMYDKGYSYLLQVPCRLLQRIDATQALWLNGTSTTVARLFGGAKVLGRLFSRSSSAKKKEGLPYSDNSKLQSTVNIAQAYS